jgi:hypothetical protein
MTVEILYIFLAFIVGLLGYFHYIINRQQKEINELWTQIAVLATSTAEKLKELQKKNESTNSK